MENLRDHFKEANYLPKKGDFGEDRLLAVNHICIQGDCVLFEEQIIPYGESVIEKEGTKVIDEILEAIIYPIQKIENREKAIIICGSKLARRMLGRKLEDRLKREVEY